MARALSGQVVVVTGASSGVGRAIARAFGRARSRVGLIARTREALENAYGASKAAIRGFTDSLRCELVHEKSRIRVTMLQLPAVNTPQFEVMRTRLPRHPKPVPPIYQPEAIAQAVLRVAAKPVREM